MEDLTVTVLPTGESGILIEADDNLGSSGLFFSADGGNTWRFEGRWCDILSPATSDPSTIYCGSSRSRNGGQTWVNIIDPAFLGNSIFNTIAFSGNENPILYIAGKDGIIYRSNNEGVDFIQISSNGLGNLPLTLLISPTHDNSFILTHSNCYITYPVWECKNYFSTDSGVTWNLLPESFHGYYAWDTNGNSLYGIKAALGGNVNTMMVSNDAGKNWVRVSTIPGPEQNPNGNSNLAWLGASPTKPGTVFVYRTGDYPAFFRSMDGGLIWEQLDLKIGNNQRFNITGNRLWAANDNELVYSDDNGGTFQNCSKPERDTNLPFTLLYMQKSNLILWGNTNDGIVQSKSNCLSWTTVPSQPEGLVINIMVSDPRDENTLYVGSNNGAFVSLDMGKSWSAINDGLLGANIIYSMVVDSQGNVFASTPYGIFKLVYK